MADELVQIASSISDVRIEQDYEYLGEDGLTRKVLLVEFPTVDDLMTQGMENIASEIRRGTEYTSIMDYDVVTQLVRTQLPVKR
jgi:hypothetical protein